MAKNFRVIFNFFPHPIRSHALALYILYSWIVD